MDNEKRYEEERMKMVQMQLIRRGITDVNVLETMKKVPRHRFVPEKLAESAYGDCPLSIGEGQTISQPYMVALMTQCLELTGCEKVLEVGTGSGYQTAILAELSGKVYTMERVEDLSCRAAGILKEFGYANIRFRVGDGSEGWSEFAPYDGVMVTAGSPGIPEPVVRQLAEKGRIVIPVGGEYSQDLVAGREKKAGLEKRTVCGCTFVPLVGKYGWRK